MMKAMSVTGIAGKILRMPVRNVKRNASQMMIVLEKTRALVGLVNVHQQEASIAEKILQMLVNALISARQIQTVQTESLVTVM